jgi:hypothetical protein
VTTDLSPSVRQGSGSFLSFFFIIHPDRRLENKTSIPYPTGTKKISKSGRAGVAQG